MQLFPSLLALAALTLPSLAQLTTSLTLNATNITLPAPTGFASPVCDVTQPLCPSCDRQNVTDQTGTTYEVFCDYTMVSTGGDDVIHGNTSVQVCLVVCDESPDCGSVNFFPNGSCALATGDSEGLISSAGYTNLLPVATATAATSSPASLTSSATASATCDLTETENLCPACDGQYLEDTNGTIFHLFCDSQLYSEGYYAPQEYLTPVGCLDQCDDYDFCTGATWWEGGNCKLAKGDDVFPTAMPSFTAFLPVLLGAAAIKPTSTKISAFPSGQPTAAPGNQTLTTVFAPKSCGVSNFTCPACDHGIISDAFNQTYQGICRKPMQCETPVPQPRNTTLDVCLQNCDIDATCVAASWNFDTGICQLCPALAPPNATSLVPSAVFLPYRAASNISLSIPVLTRTRPALPTGYTARPATVSAVSNALNSTAVPRTGFNPGGPIINITTTLSRPAYTPGVPFANTTVYAPSASVPIVVATGPGPVVIATAPVRASSTLRTSSTSSSVFGFDAEITAVACPLYDSSVVENPADGGYIEVMCNAGLAAAHSRYTSASDFAACATLCSAACNGVQFGSSTSCGLFTSITAVAASSGWTAGASIYVPIAATTSSSSTVASTGIKSTTGAPTAAK